MILYHNIKVAINLQLNYIIREGTFYYGYYY